MAGKSALSLVVTFSIFFTGCAASNTIEKPAAETAVTEKTSVSANSETPEVKDPKAEAKKQYTDGMISMNHANWVKAEEHFLKADKLDPGNYNTHMLLARVYEKKKQKIKAQEYYKKAIAIKPAAAGPYAGLMGIYFEMGLTDFAISTATDAFKNGVSEDALAGYIGWAYYQKGDLEKAEKYLKKDKELNTLDSTPRNNLGLVYFNQGRYDDALANSKEASELNKKSVVLPYFLAVTYNRLGKEDEVLKALQEGLKRDPNLEMSVPLYNASFFPRSKPDDLSAVFKKLKEEKN
jgi:tetratricopeptide (TPR) repeat protein